MQHNDDKWFDEERNNFLARDAEILCIRHEILCRCRAYRFK